MKRLLKFASKEFMQTNACKGPILDVRNGQAIQTDEEKKIRRLEKDDGFGS